MASASCIGIAWVTGCEAVNSAGSSTNTVVLVSPAAVFISVTNVSEATFTASGGTGIYTWSVGNSALGQLLYTNDATAFYQNTTGRGTNTIIAADSNGQLGSATIIQE